MICSLHFLVGGEVVPMPSKWAPKGVWVLQGLSPSLPAHPSTAPPRRLREGSLRGGQGVRGSCLVPWGLRGRALRGCLHMWVSPPLQGEAGPPGLPGPPVSIPVSLQWGDLEQRGH